MIAYYRTRLQHQVASLAEKMQALNPDSVLARGYTIVKKKQTVLTAAAQLEPGDTLVLQFHDGQRTVLVKD
jgi:exodeoxyribonuclease VII large subunit